MLTLNSECVLNYLAQQHMRSLLCATAAQGIAYSSVCTAESGALASPCSSVNALALTLSRALPHFSYGTSAVQHLGPVEPLLAKLPGPPACHSSFAATVAPSSTSASWKPAGAGPQPFLGGLSSATSASTLGVGKGYAHLSSREPACLGAQSHHPTQPGSQREPHQQQCRRAGSAAGLAQLWQHRRRHECLVTASVLPYRAISTPLTTCGAPRGPASPQQQPRALFSTQPQQQPGQQAAPASEKSSGAPDAVHQGGLRPPRPAADSVYNLPNAVSVARLLSGPVIGVWLLQGHYEVATVALAISGASDWVDGYLARRMGASSVFGSYLDPLADKVLIGCVAGALLANGAMPGWLAAVVVGRDVALVSGAFMFRLRGFGWRWPGKEAFFRTADVAAATTPSAATTTASRPSRGDNAAAAATAGGGGGGGGVAFMRPLLISKANTVLQLVLLGGYLTRGTYGWPEGDLVTALELATAATTLASMAAYGSNALQGKLFK